MIPTKNIDNMREDVRELKKQERHTKRFMEFNKIRDMWDEENYVSYDKAIISEDVVMIANRINQRGQSISKDLALLKTYLIQSNDNIDVFLSVPGALNSLVHYMTGKLVITNNIYNCKP